MSDILPVRPLKRFDAGHSEQSDCSVCSTHTPLRDRTFGYGLCSLPRPDIHVKDHSGETNTAHYIVLVGDSTNRDVKLSLYVHPLRRAQGGAQELTPTPGSVRRCTRPQQTIHAPRTIACQKENGPLPFARASACQLDRDLSAMCSAVLQ